MPKNENTFNPESPRFEQLLSEEKVTPKDLPAALSQKIKNYKATLGKYKVKPTESTIPKLDATDLEIVDAIQSWLEEDIEEETPEEIATMEAKEKSDKDKADKEASDKVEADRIAAEKKEKEDKEAKDKEEAERIEKEKKEKESKATAPDAEKAKKVESELKSLYDSEKNSLTLQQLKSAAPVCYATIFEIYKEGEENGIETTRYRLVETEKEQFELTKI